MDGADDTANSAGDLGSLRAFERRAYGGEILYAPCAGADVPPRPAFSKTRGRDVSRGGVSFYLPHRADFPYVLVGIGEEPRTQYYLARVAHCTEWAPDGVTKGYVVGCTFVRRVAKSEVGS